jgi:hypothetical protein
MPASVPGLPRGRPVLAEQPTDAAGDVDRGPVLEPSSDDL